LRPLGNVAAFAGTRVGWPAFRRTRLPLTAPDRKELRPGIEANIKAVEQDMLKLLREAAR
jgi:hypothetical protein